MSEIHPHNDSTASYRDELQADCENCFGLCCVALPFSVSVDFAMDKEAGRPCPNLREDFRCGIHRDLRETGFRGCTVYDCFGAGQKVSQVSYGGRDWRQNPDSAGQMYEVFPVMRQLHELLWYLNETLTLLPASSLHEKIGRAHNETERLAALPPEDLLALDIHSHRAEINLLLLRTSQLVREDAQRKHPSKRRKSYERGADLVGAKLRGADLIGANLRSALLIAADLREADLRFADLIGADFRDADIRGADLTGVLFLTQAQLNAAKGDAATRLPPGFVRPSHWTSGKSANAF